MQELFNFTDTVSKPASITEELASFNDFGSTTHVSELITEEVTIPVYTNEFWTSKQRAAHSLHEISYRACFKPQLPKFFIERFSQKGDTVYDPFMGRGTTLLESSLLQRQTIGCDLNPLSRILLTPRLHPPSYDDVKKRLNEIDFQAANDASQDADLLVFFHPKTLQAINSLKSYLAGRHSTNTADNIDRWIQMVASNRLTGHSAGFFSVYTLPPNQSVSVVSQQRINAKRDQTPPYRDVPTLILKKTKSLLRDYKEGQLDSKLTHRVIIGSADDTPLIESSSVDLIITSPPFLDVIDYRADNWLRCWMNGIDSNELPIWQVRNPDAWTSAFKKVFKELHRVLKPNGTIAFEVGEVNKGTLKMEEMVIPAATSAGLEPVCVMVNAQVFTKTSNCWGVNNGVKGTNSNRVVILRKK